MYYHVVRMIITVPVRAAYIRLSARAAHSVLAGAGRTPGVARAQRPNHLTQLLRTAWWSDHACK